MPSVKTYDPDAVLLAVGGQPAEGFASGSFVTIKRNAKRFQTEVGGDGEVTRVKSADKTATCTLVLKQSSEFNRTLSLLVAADEATGGGITPFLFKSGNDIIAAAQCWIEEEPEVSVGTEEEERTWVIALGNCDPFLVAGISA